MKCRWATQFEIIEGASAFHKRVGHILATDPLFRNTKCFQEVPVPDLLPDYPDRHRIDWWLEDYGIAVELHGAQHYKVVNFGNVSVRKAESDFNAILYRDNLKKTALLEAGFQYREIHYRYAKKLTPELFRQLVFGDESDAKHTP